MISLAFGHETIYFAMYKYKYDGIDMATTMNSVFHLETIKTQAVETDQRRSTLTLQNQTSFRKQLRKCNYVHSHTHTRARQFTDDVLQEVWAGNSQGPPLFVAIRGVLL